MLGIEHGENAASFLLHALDLVKLGKRRHARLVGQYVLAVAHGGKADVGAVAGNGGGDDDLDRSVFKDRTRVGNALGFRILGREGCSEVILDRMEGDEFRTGPLEAVHLPVDMGVIDADGGKFQV